MNIDAARKILNKQQTNLRQIMMRDAQYKEAINLFLSHHAMLHSAQVADYKHWSHEDALLNDMDEAQIRRIPQNCEHSMAWLLWHMARIEDVTMNVLIAGALQIMHQDNWLAQLKISAQHTGNVIMSEADVVQLSNAVDIGALRAYRAAVGKQTQVIAKKLPLEELKQKVAPERLQQLRDDGAVVDEATDLLDYWGKRTVAGLLLMPATRHNIVHLNEMYRLKKRR